MDLLSLLNENARLTNAQLAVMLGKTEEEVEKEIWIPFQMITPDNADEYVDRY